MRSRKATDTLFLPSEWLYSVASSLEAAATDVGLERQYESAAQVGIKGRGDDFV
jgi:hypothetical protein